MSETSKNKTIITGLLYQVQPRKTKTGKFVCAFTVAVVEGNGAKQFISVTGWQGLGERVAAMGVGSKIYIAGRLRTASWTDSSGHKRYRTEIVADTAEEITSLQSSQPGSCLYSEDQSLTRIFPFNPCTRPPSSRAVSP